MTNVDWGFLLCPVALRGKIVPEHFSQKAVANLLCTNATPRDVMRKIVESFSIKTIGFWTPTHLKVKLRIVTQNLFVSISKNDFVFGERFRSAVSGAYIFPLFSISLLGSATLAALELKRNAVCLVQTEEEKRSTKISLTESLRKL